MSKKPPVVKIGRIIIRTPEENAAEAARLIKALNARNKAVNRLLPRTKITDFNSSKHNPAQPARPGSENALDLPSRIGDHLHYRDGRVLPFPL